jgi:hypothetical protein
MTLEDTYTSPIGFITKKLELPLYEWQEDAVTPLEFAAYGSNIVQISVLAPNGAGKSSRIVAGAACYWLAMHGKGKVGITTKDGRQLNEQVIPAIEAQIGKFEGWRSVRAPYYKLTTSTGGVLIAFTTDDANRVEGLHGSPDSPLLWIVDEAKSVGEPIFTGIDRCGYQAIIYASSGGLAGFGSFWESHHGKTSKSFIKVRAGLIDCPCIEPGKVERILLKYGEDHPHTRSIIYGEFMEQGDADEYIVTTKSLQACLNSPPKHRPGLKAGFCDFGAGTAEHVLAVRDGNKYDLAACWIEANKDATAGRFIREFRRAGFTPEDCPHNLKCDASDKEIWQKLALNGWPLGRQNFGAPARLKTEYQSWSAEAWIEGAIKISNGEVILPDDDTMKAQMVNRKKTYTTAGKLCAEDKLEMAERGVESPDRADAIFGVMSLPERFEQKQPFTVTGWRDHIPNSGEMSIDEEIGALV